MDPTIDLNGIAHLQLSVADFDRSRAFYARLLPAMGMVPLMDFPGAYYYCVGGRTGLAISPAAAEHAADGFVQTRPGLHHLCFRLRSREDVDRLHALAVEIGAKIVRPPEEANWAPGYYSTLFEDPDGIRLEGNFVPGKGHLEGR
jgi:catechol 2,3-dioxygenase-like lactoylglutathione lyase family enzyme